MGIFGGTPDYAVDRNGVGHPSGIGKVIEATTESGGHVQDGGSHGGNSTK